MVYRDVVGVACCDDPDRIVDVPAEIGVGTDPDPVGIVEKLRGHVEERLSRGFSVGGLDAQEDREIRVIGFEDRVDAIKEVLKTDKTRVGGGGESPVGLNPIGEVIWVELGNQEPAPVEIRGDDIGIVDRLGCPFWREIHVVGIAPVWCEPVASVGALSGGGDIDLLAGTDSCNGSRDVIEECLGEIESFESFWPGDAVVVVDCDEIAMGVDELGGVVYGLLGRVVGKAGESHVEGSFKGEGWAGPFGLGLCSMA